MSLVSNGFMPYISSSDEVGDFRQSDIHLWLSDQLKEGYDEKSPGKVSRVRGHWVIDVCL